MDSSLDMILNSSLENLPNVLHNTPYEEIYHFVRHDVLFDILNSTAEFFLNQYEFHDIIENKNGRDMKAFFEMLPDKQKQMYQNSHVKIYNTFMEYLICKKYFHLEYDEFRVIQDANFEKIQFKNHALKDLVSNVKDILNGKYFIYAKPVLNVKEEILKSFQEDMNQHLTSCDKLESLDYEILNQYGITYQGTEHLLDSGNHFTMLIKDMSYAGRVGESYQEKWNEQETNFLYESKSLIDESMVTSISKLNGRLKFEENWIVGFNNVSELQDASSADLGNMTRNGKLFTQRKVGHNVVHLADTKTLLAHTGTLQDDNTMMFDYNEIVDKKYMDHKKIAFDYVVLPLTTNENSKFSKFKQERFENAVKISEEFHCPIVVQDLDRILEYQISEVKEKINTYMETKNINLLDDILQQIRKNRTADYALEAFNNDFLSEVLVDVYEDKPEVLEVIRRNLDNMVGFSKEDIKFIFEGRMTKLRKMVNDNSLQEILNATDFNQIITFITDEEREDVKKLLEELKKEEKKFFKRKKNIQLLKEQIISKQASLLLEYKKNVMLSFKELGMDFPEGVEINLQESYDDFVREKNIAISNLCESPSNFAEVIRDSHVTILEMETQPSVIMEEKKTNSI